ncbi:MAG: MFS transporter [Desulfobacterales bacterium]
MGDWRTKTTTFYGWWIVGVLFILLFNTGGMGFYVFPVFIESFQQEFGWTLTQISVSAGIWAIVFGFSGPVIGFMIARFGARKIIVTAAIIAGLTNFLFASLTALWMLYLGTMISGFVVAGTTLIPAQTLITNWFNRYRGRAMGLAMAGIGFGGFCLPSFNEYFIRTFGWREAWLFASLVLFVLLIPLILFFIRSSPEELGLLPDGDSAAGSTGPGKSRPKTGMTPKRALKTKEFWLLAFIFLLILTGSSALSFHFVPFVTLEVGFTNQQGAFFLGLTIGFSIVGRLVYGWLADHYNLVLLMVSILLLMACGPAVLWIFFLSSGFSEVNYLWLFAVPYGIAIGSNAILFPVLIGRCFGELHFSKILGLLMSGFAIGIIVGIPVSGKIFDATGSYELVLKMSFLVFVLAIILMLFVRPNRYHGEFRSF